jgi:hypothetical protein
MMSPIVGLLILNVVGDAALGPVLPPEDVALTEPAPVVHVAPVEPPPADVAPAAPLP